MTIKHIVISGGGPSGLISYGILSKLSQLNFWNIHNIESLWGCSAGAIISVVLLLEYRWDWMDDFFIKRPWNKIVDITPESILNINSNRGVMNEDTICNLLGPLFEGKDLDRKITMKELYDVTRKDFHIFTTNLNTTTLEKIDINHKNYPDIPVYKAVYMSLSIPGLCNPIINEEGCFIDGGYINHFPLMDCVEHVGNCGDEIFGVNLNSLKTNKITTESSLIEVMFNIASKLVDIPNSANLCGEDKIKYVIKCSPKNSKGIIDWWNLAYDDEKRKDFIAEGHDIANSFFLEKSNNNTICQDSS